QFPESVSKHWRVWLALKPTQEAADALALEFLHGLTHGADRDSAVVLAKLYQQAGRYGDARRVLADARALHPRDADLWDLTLKCVADLAQEEAVEREMVLLFPEESKCALAVGARRGKRGNHIGDSVVLLTLMVAWRVVVGAK